MTPAPHPETDDTVLVVDLDGTLIRSDMLYESFWSGFARDWRTPFWAIAGLARGRAALKARMAQCGTPDVTTLPYTQPVLDHIAAWRAKGGRTALVTAADQSIADAVATHLGCFDDVHGSDGQTNLKGAAKAALLKERYARFVYMGDSPADLPVWQAANGAVTVHAGATLRARAAAVQPDIQHLATPSSALPAMLRAMRPHQWAKNFLVFFPMIAAHAFSTGLLLSGLVAFMAFSMVASSVYLLNDLLDIGSDRAHPRKRTRPLASGALPLRIGMMMVPILLGVGVVLALLLPPLFLLVLAGYYLVTVAYSLWLKRKPLIDICTLGVLYTFRIAAGSVALGIVLSEWLLAFSAFLFLSLAAVKRQAELIDLQSRGREATAGRGYKVVDLPIVSQMATAAGFMAVLVLMLYINEDVVRQQYSQPSLLWGTCLVLLYWVSRMILLTQRGCMHDDPIVFAMRDKVSLAAFGLMALFVVAATSL